MDTRRRISFNMNTGGGQPTEPSTGGTYTVNLNGQWEATTAIPNPDSTLYDGVYRSSSSYNVNNGVSTMYIDISGYSEFTLYIRSYAESNYDYVMVSELDKTITSGSSTTDTTLVKAHTKGNQKSGTTISDYTEVKYTNIDGGSHRITILYRKDSGVNSGDDRGYVLIKKQNASGGSTPDNPGTGGDTSGPINTSNYMTILALEDGLTAKLSTNACQYCVDGDGNWIDLPAGTTTQSINSGQTLSFKGNLIPKSYGGIGTFTISKNCNLEGNCMSMLFGDNAMNNYSLSGKYYAFWDLFSQCDAIIHVSETFLPATILSNSCYRNMFYHCDYLTTAPKLPATTLTNYCYRGMFSNCVRMTVAPELPATTLARNCYEEMFSKCSWLTESPKLPATTLADQCYNLMFYDIYGSDVFPDCSNIDFTSISVVKSGGLRGLFAGTKVTDNDLYNILPINPATGKYWLPATTLASDCYDRMFYDCESLTTAPELPATAMYSSCYYRMFMGCKGLRSAPKLPATTLANYCYTYMFCSCDSLTTAPELPATALADYCYKDMFSDCTSLTTAPALPATTLARNCYAYMFSDCTSLKTSPVLSATTLADYCYQGMFSRCTKLNYIKMLATDISASGCLSSWVQSVSSTGKFVKNPAMTSLPTGSSGIPSGWTVVDNN